jgi:hypothetical protein
MLTTVLYDNVKDGADFTYISKGSKGGLRMAIKITGDNFLHLSLAKRKPIRRKASISIKDGVVSCDESWVKDRFSDRSS